MNLPMIMLGIGGAMLVISLLHCFFGYKLARFLLPVCGALLIEGVLYIFVYETLMLDAMGTWLFFAGTGLAVYITLFFFTRIAAFFTGLSGAALLLLFVVHGFSLHTLPLLYPIGFTVCLICGLLAAVYKKIGVVAFSALFGGCAAAFIGFYLFFESADMSWLSLGNILLPFEKFLVSRIIFIGIGAAALTLIGIVVQIKLTAHTQVLEGRLAPGGSFRLRRSNTADMV